MDTPKSICQMLVNVLKYCDRATICNQGQAMDGFTELANYRAIAERAKIVVEKI